VPAVNTPCGWSSRSPVADETDDPALSACDRPYPSRRCRHHEHWFGGGAIKRFCCNQNVPSLPAWVDDTFSSVYQG
jgi:hypothetical protein